MLEKVQADRQAKLDQIRALGIDPYGGRYETAEPVAEILSRYQDGKEDQRADAAGRLILIRRMGKLIFAHIRDQSGQIQIALRKNALDETAWKLAGLLDLGDLIAVAGPVAKTRTGEITVWAERLTLLCKSLNPMPEKFHGLADIETRYRRRYLDLMTNPESMTRFRLRADILEHFRSVLRARGFLEVETPMMQPIYGGGAARPFTTHHNALDADLYLRISPELYLKRLLVGGMEKVFEINRQFRNEGLDTRHHPEFTMLELYQAYADYNVMMEITEELIATAVERLAVPALLARAQAQQERIEAIAQEKGPPEATAEREALRAVFEAAELCRQGRLALPYGRAVIDYTRPWRRARYGDLLLEHAGVSMNDPAAVRQKARELEIEEANKDDAVVVNEVFEATVEPQLLQPTFVMDYPAPLCPLTRRKPDEPDLALRFELFVARMEIANAYSELNDPAVQEANFRQQLRGEAENETMRIMDEDFITALRHGMPPAGGLGVGIDRVVMLLTDTPSIRDVILFPLLRPERPDSQATSRPENR